MTTCYYCGNRTRLDYSSTIAELDNEVMCNPCSKRRGSSPHKLFAAVVLHGAEQQAIELSNRIERLRYAVGITKALSPPAKELTDLVADWEDD
jgi:hypothetical protein